MAKEGPDWQGLLKWSLANADGTQAPRNLSEEDRKWFMEAMQGQTIDVVKRMKEITLVMQTPEHVLTEQGVTSSDIEDLLDELQEHVESIDMANDLHSIGGLLPLIAHLKNSHPGIRAKAAEVITTIVQNNPRSQQLVMDSNGLSPLLTNFSTDEDITVRTKALGAISSLIRHNKPGVTAFRLGNGYATLKDALSSDNVRFQRKSLHLIHYLLQENASDCKVVSELGFVKILIHLVSSEDGEVREAALRGLIELVREGSLSLGDGESLKGVLRERIKGIEEMNEEELGAAKEERELVDRVWSECFGEASELREKGLVVLPGEEENVMAPGVASKYFEPPLRAQSVRPVEVKKEAPLLLGLGPPPSSS